MIQAFIILFEFDFTFVHIQCRLSLLGDFDPLQNLTYINLKTCDSIITLVYSKTD